MVRFKLATSVVIFFLGVTNIFGQDLETAKGYALAERYDDAKEMLNKIIQSEPNNAGAYFYLGQTIIREYLSDSISNSLGDVCTQAQKAFETGLQKDSMYLLNHVGRGMIAQLCNNDTSAANAAFQRALIKFPKNKKKYTEIHGLVYIKMAFACMLGNKQRFPQAVTYINKAKEIAPQSYEIAMMAGDIYLARKDGSNAIQNYSLAESVNEKSPLPLIRKGDLYLAAKNYDLSRSYYDQAKEMDPSNASVYKSYGELWSLAGKYQLAKENFLKYLELAGNNIPAKVSIVGPLYKTRDFDEAIAVIKEIQAVDDSRNYLNRVAGYSAFDKKNPNYEMADQYMTKFFKNAQPSSITPRDYLYHGRTLIKLKTDSATIAKGVDLVYKAYELTKDEELITEIAASYMYIEDYKNAIATYNKKVAAGTATTADLMQLAKAYANTQDFVKAGETYDKVVAADPKYMPALTNAAVAYANQDPDSKLGLAKPKYEAVIALANTDPKKYSRELFEAYRYMASYYLYGEDKSARIQSEDYFKKIIALDANNKEWQKVAYGGLAALYTELAPNSSGTGRWEQAKSMFQELLKLDPGNKTAQSAIVNIQKQINMIRNLGGN